MQRTISWQLRTLFGLAFSIVSTSLAAEDWHLEKSQGPVQVYTRTPALKQHNVDYQEILARTFVSAAPQAFVDLLETTDKAPDWIDNCLQVKLLSKTSAHINIVQSTFAAPWPLQNRDIVTQSTMRNVDEKIIISINDQGNAWPLQKNTVRMKHVTGQWTISPTENGSTEITYQGSGHPSGNIPDWLAKQVLVSSTFKTFIKLTHTLNQNQHLTREITD